MTYSYAKDLEFTIEDTTATLKKSDSLITIYEIQDLFKRSDLKEVTTLDLSQCPSLRNVLSNDIKTQVELNSCSTTKTPGSVEQLQAQLEYLAGDKKITIITPKVRR